MITKTSNLIYKLCKLMTQDYNYSKEYDTLGGIPMHFDLSKDIEIIVTTSNMEISLNSSFIAILNIDGIKINKSFIPREDFIHIKNGMDDSSLVLSYGRDVLDIKEDIVNQYESLLTKS